MRVTFTLRENNAIKIINHGLNLVNEGLRSPKEKLEKSNQDQLSEKPISEKT